MEQKTFVWSQLKQIKNQTKKKSKQNIINYASFVQSIAQLGRRRLSKI